jgi:putative transposase
VNGRRRHVVVDTLGNLLRVSVQSGEVLDAPGALLVFEKLKPKFECLSHFWADRAYRGWLVKWVKDNLDATLDIVAKPDGSPTFILLPRRWVVERTLAWLGRFRRLSKDYEHLPTISETFIYVASIRRLVRLLAT